MANPCVRGGFGKKNSFVLRQLMSSEIGVLGSVVRIRKTRFQTVVSNKATQATYSSATLAEYLGVSLVFPIRTCPHLSLPPANSFVIGTAVINTQ